MNSDKLISIEDADLDLVAGGLGLNLTADLGRLVGICVGANVGHGSASATVSAHVGPISLDASLGLSINKRF